MDTEEKRKIGREEDGKRGKEVPFGQDLNASGEVIQSETGGHHSSFIVHHFIRPFDLSRAPLFRAGLIKEEEDKHIMMMEMHHIIADGVSSGVIIKDFMSFYGGKGLFDLRIHYKDFSEWQNSTEVKESIKQQEEYWLKEFEDRIPTLNLPTDYSRPVVRSFEGSRYGYEVDKEDTTALKTYALENGITLFMVLLAVYNIFLSKLSSQEDIAVGTPIAGRRHTDLEHIVGMFVNTLALRNFPEGNKNVKQFLEEVKARTLESFSNQDYQYEELVERAPIFRDTGRNPLFDTMFVLQNFDVPEVNIPGLNLKPYTYDQSTSKFDLTLQCLEMEERLSCTFEYSTKLFKTVTIERFINYFKKVISAVLDSPTVKIRDIEIISGKEKKQILAHFNKTEAPYPQDKTIVELFAVQVEKTPHRTALIYIDHQVTYGVLDNKGDRVGQALMEKGIGPDFIVGLMAERSIEMIVGILGILKAGAAYLPIDPGYPEERIQYILSDGGVKFLLAAPGTRIKVKADLKEGSIERIDISNLLSFSISTLTSTCQVSPTNLAYVIYTSGSTGKPKGVMVEHGSVVNILSALHMKYPFAQRDTYLLKTSYLFDVSVTELFGWYLGGGRLAVLEIDREKDPIAIMVAAEHFDVTHINFVPSMFNVFVQQLELNPPFLSKISSLKYIFLAGEALLPGLVRRFRSLNTSIKLENIYGPTEGTIYSSYYSLADWDDTGRIPIGKPMQNFRLYILDKNNNLQPVGIPGKLLISGVGVARGYLNRPGLTVERFINFSRFNRSYRSYITYKSHKSYISNKLYKTGDLARWLPDGNIDFLGRIDYQVKIRGFRIELGEIESQLVTHDDIKETVLVAKVDDKGDKYLCAYIVSDIEPSVSELREFLSVKLPDYMIPAYFVPLKSIPLTPNGKVDRKALPEPVFDVGTGVYSPPRNIIEKQLARIWSELLGIDKAKLDIDANFFAIGGHSLKATVMVAKIHKELNVDLPMMAIFKTPTIRGLSDYIKGLTEDKFVSIESAEEKEYYELSSAQKRLYIVQQMDLKSTTYHLPLTAALEGEINIGKMDSIFKKLINRHEVLKTSFETIDGKGFQKIHREVEFEIEYYDLQVTGAGDRCRCEEEPHGQIPNSKFQIPNKKETGCHHSSFIIHHSFIRPFDLSQAPLMRVGIIKEEERKHILMIDMHHIISDGISMEILVKEFMALYVGKELPGLRSQYKDFSEYQNRLLESKEIEKQETFWLNKFKGDIPRLNMPLDYKRPAVKNFEGDKIYFEIGRELTFKIEQLNKEAGTTLFIVLLAIYNVLLHKYTGQTDISIGSPVSGRRHVDLQNLLGVFVNMIAFRNQPAPEKSFMAFLEEVQANAVGAYENQDYQFEELVRRLGLQGETGRNPIFDVGFVMQNIDSGYMMDTTLDDIKKGDLLKVTPHDTENRVSRFDMLLGIDSMSNKIGLSLEYSTQLFRKSSAEIICKHFKEILQQVLENKEIKLKDVTISSDLQAVKPGHVNLDFEFYIDNINIKRRLT